MLVHSKCSKNGNSYYWLWTRPRSSQAPNSSLVSGTQSPRGVWGASDRASGKLLYSCLASWRAPTSPPAQRLLLFKAYDTRREKPLWDAVTGGSWLTGFVYTQVLSMGSLTFWRMSFNSMKVIVCPVALGETELNKGHEGLGLCWEETRWWGCFMSSKSWADIGDVARWVVITWADGGGGRHFLPQSDCPGISSDL